MLLTATILGACTQEELITKRLEGTWDVKKVDYSAKIILPPPISLEIPVSGISENSGNMVFSKKNKECSYDISFTTKPIELTGLGTIPATPITIKGSGTWANTDKEVTITNSDSLKTKFVFAVQKNERFLQEWKTTINYQIAQLGNTPVPVTLVITMEKKQ